MSKPLLSIITVSFNAEETIRDTIESVLDQNDVDGLVEYIVVDGASKDSTLDIVREYEGRIDKVVSEPDKGLYDAMNKGVAMAQGEYVGILNSDDVYASDDILSKVLTLLQKSGSDSLYGDLVYVEREDLSKVTRTWKAGAYRENAFSRGWMPPHPTFFLRKSMYDKHGTYSLALKSAADYELMLRMIHLHQVSTVYLPTTMVKMRAGGVSNASLKNRLRANREDREAWRMNGIKPGFLTLYMKPARKIGQFLKK